MLLAAFTVSAVLSIFLGSSAKLQLRSDAMVEDKKLLESSLDNPNYFEGDLDISQAIINAYYEQQSGKNVLFFAELDTYSKTFCTTEI